VRHIIVEEVLCYLSLRPRDPWFAQCLRCALIKVLGRWSSDCFELNIRTPKTVLFSYAGRMGSVSFSLFCAYPVICLVILAPQLSVVIKSCNDFPKLYFLLFSGTIFHSCGRRSGLMVSKLNSPGWGHCVEFLDKTLDSHSASLHPGV